ncbi:MAG: UdgX family uracil-DNA binding protein, partial [Polyangiales bacterium]
MPPRQKSSEEIGSAADFVPPHPTLDSLKEAAAKCTACPLYKLGTQTVFGNGLREAAIVLVGEQPGDQEDKAGLPFVGPAGRLLDKALEEAGIDRTAAYVTNVVKHFKWEPRGKRRIHSKPNVAEIRACKPWVEEELKVVKPEVLVCMGSTAAQALLGKGFKVTEQRGQLIETTLAPHAFATIHPSSILRERDEEARHRAMKGFVDDLRIAAQLLRQI